MRAAIEHELDPVTLERTGRQRRAQFGRTIRREAVPPSRRSSAPFVWPISCAVHVHHSTACDACLEVARASAIGRGWRTPDPECTTCGHVASDHPRGGQCGASVEDEDGNAVRCGCARLTEPSD